MGQVTRRDWLRMLVAAGVLPSLPKVATAQAPVYDFQDVRVAISPENPAICFDESKCLFCGACLRMCRRTMSVSGFYDLTKTGNQPICVHCGQCSLVCEGDAILNRADWQAVRAAKARGQTVVVSLSPAVRVMVSEAFGAAAGTYCEGEVIAALRALGADYVLDTATGADLAVVEEATEWVARLQTPGAALPQMTSCCSSWVKFCETYFPERLSHVSAVKSPIAIQGVLVKSFFAEAKGLKPEQIFNVALTPCTAKKFEIRRPELQINGLPGVDAVVTVRELADWIQAEGVDYRALQPSTYDALLGEASGAGVMLGSTGGTSEALLRTAYRLLNGVNPPDDFFNLKAVRGLKGTPNAVVNGVKMAMVQLTPERRVTVLAVQGLARMRKVMACLEEGTLSADLIEVMACEGGCIGGGGTPRAKSVPYLSRAMRQARMDALFAGEARRKVRLAHENPIVKTLYQTRLGKPGSEAARTVLHTNYTSRARDLG